MFPEYYNIHQGLILRSNIAGSGLSISVLEGEALSEGHHLDPHFIPNHFFFVCFIKNVRKLTHISLRFSHKKSADC